ncbi:MAG: hypothetical protein ACRCUT_10570, partial [Spirochaetota bacterium]
MNRVKKMRLCLAAALAAVCLFPASARSAEKLSYYYAGESGRIVSALGLAGWVKAADAESSDLIVYNGILPDAAKTAALVAQGKGLLLIMGAGVDEKSLGTILHGAGIKQAADPLSVYLSDSRKDGSLFARDFDWAGA